MVQLLLYTVVFISGAVLMALGDRRQPRARALFRQLDLRLGQPDFSVVMAALSHRAITGAAGCRRREPSYGQAARCFLIPGVMIFFLPFIYPPVNDWIAAADFGTRLNPLIACSALFLAAGDISGR